MVDGRNASKELSKHGKGQCEDISPQIRDFESHLRLLRPENENQSNDRLADISDSTSLPTKKPKIEQLTMSRSESIRDRLSRSVSPIKSPSRFTPDNPEIDHVHISAMVEELRAARALNRSLTEKLAQAEADLEAARKSREEMQIEMEAKVAARGAALIDKIYTAQKERDNAVIGRLKLANEERDEYLARLRRLEKDHGFDSGVESGSVVDGDMDLINYDELSLPEIIKRVSSTDHIKAIERQGAMIADRIANANRANKKKSDEENTVLLRERDEAKAQVRRLQAEIKEMQHEREMAVDQFRLNEKTRLKACQAQLKAATREKEEAEKRARLFEDELQKIRIYYSLHKSLSQEQVLRDQFNTTMDNFEEKLKQKEAELQIAQKSYDELVAKLNSTIREKNVMASQLQDSLEQLKEEKARADKLERLVGVLRKRITQGPSVQAL